MNRIDRLKAAYSAHIQIPWRSDASSNERVIFCVYGESDELILRSRIEEFAIETTKAGHTWSAFDCTNTFENWLSQMKYRERYFERPELIMSAISRYHRNLTDTFSGFVEERKIDENSVLAIIGVGALFGFLKVHEVVATFAPDVPGRLVVFFPGNYENNNYRLLDAYDGWNYLAVPITASSEF